MIPGFVNVVVDSFVQEHFLSVLVLELCMYGIILEHFEISRSVCLSQILMMASVFPSTWEACGSSWVPFSNRVVIIGGI